MKKILTNLVTLICATFLVACGHSLDQGSYTNEDLNVFDLLQSSHAAQENLTSMIMSVYSENHITRTGEQTETSSVSVRIEMENEVRLRFDYESSFSMDTIFLRDGYMYSEMNRRGLYDTPLRFRDEVNNFLMMELNQMVSFFNTSFLTEEMLINAEAMRIDEGYRLTFELDIDGVHALAFAHSLGMEGVVDELFDEAFEDFYFSTVMYLDEDHLPISTQITGSISFEDELDEFVMSSTLIQVGDVTIDFPYWLDELKYGVESDSPDDFLDHDPMIEASDYHAFFGEYLQFVGHENFGFALLPESWQNSLSVFGEHNHLLSLSHDGFNISMDLIEPELGPASGWAEFLHRSYTNRFDSEVTIETVHIGSYEAFRLTAFDEDGVFEYRTTFVFNLPDRYVQQIVIIGSADVVAEIEALFITTFRR